MAIRGWQLTESTVAGWNDTGLYLYDPAQKTTTLVNNYAPSSTAMTFYENEFIEDEGSWLLATVPSSGVPSGWLNLGGVENLTVTGTSIPTSVNGEQVMRPKVLFWWVPDATLASVETAPQTYAGDIVGPHPLIPPTDAPPDEQIQVERTANGVIVTVPPSSNNTTIQVAVGS